MLLRTRNICKLVNASRSLMFARSYHTYPDPAETAVINVSTSQVQKTLNKDSPEFKLDSTFKMDKLFPGVPLSKGISKTNPPPTLTTKLSNGLTISTQEMPGMMSSFAFLVRTGSSYENQLDGSELGLSHFLELNAFRSSKQRDHAELLAEMEQLGGMIQCLTTRENILYCVDVLRNNLEKALDLLGDTILYPTFPEHEIEESKQIVEFQRAEADANVVSRDLVQMAAYQGYPLGNHHYCPLKQVNNITSDKVRAYRNKHFYGGNCIISAAGAEHESFVKMVEAKFGTALPSGTRTLEDTVRVPSKFTGGMLTEQRDLKEPFVKVAMAFEVGGWSDDMLVATCVLQQLLGGGSSFSAGGPGKGMYSRLYSQVLNRHHYIESVEAFVSIHESNGLFGIDCACPPEYISNVIRVVVEHFSRLALVTVTDIELSRAKNMLKSMMMMQLESRLVICEDIGRQFITYGKRDSPSLMCDRIDRVTAADLQKVGKRMFDQLPAVSIVGHDISHAPSYDDIKTYITGFREEAVKQFSSL